MRAKPAAAAGVCISSTSSSWAHSVSASRVCRACSRAFSPVSAITRRTPDDTASSAVISGYFSPNNIIAPACRASANGTVHAVMGAAASMQDTAFASIVASCSPGTAERFVKSNRNQSSSTLEPCCCACVPRFCCSAWCKICVAECARRIACRRASSTTAITRLPVCNSPSSR